ncbi:MAG: hypothetical protein KIG16_03800 [Eubacteriales bacterium]|nr:hypothetical protein [Eubacteriales bacterium]
MKHWWKTLVTALVCGLSATIFAACGKQLNAATLENTIPPQQIDEVETPETPVIDTPTEDTRPDTTVCTHDHHELDELIESEPAKCTQDGYNVYRCHDCGETYQVPNGEKALNHDPVTFNTATATEGGKLTTICQRCREILSEEDSAPLGHNDDDEPTTDDPTIDELTMDEPATPVSPLENLDDTYWAVGKCAIKFVGFTLTSQNDQQAIYTGTYTSFRYENGKVSQKLSIYKGSYTLTIRYGTNTAYYLSFTDDNDENNANNNLTYKPATTAGKIVHQFEGDLLFKYNNCTLIFIEDEVQ